MVPKHTSSSFATLAPAEKLSPLPLSVTPTPQELSDQRLSWRNLELATRALHRDGLVVIEDAIDHAKLDFLNKKMIQDALVLQSAGDESPYNFNKGNLQQDPPMTSQYFEPSIFLNPLATQVTSTVLGPRPRLSFVSGNTALPPVPGVPPQSQPIHSDCDFDHPNCPFALVVNVPLVEMTPKNGSTEVWLGTHVGSGFLAQEAMPGDRGGTRVKPNLLEERAMERPPSQPTIKKGSIIIRDLRLWHGGKPNWTKDARVLLAMIHWAPWYRSSMHVEFAESLRPILDVHGSDLQIQGTFMPEEDIYRRYLNRPYGHAYDFDQTDSLRIFDQQQAEQTI